MALIHGNGEKSFIGNNIKTHNYENTYRKLWSNRNWNC